VQCCVAVQITDIGIGTFLKQKLREVQTRWIGQIDHQHAKQSLAVFIFAVDIY